MIKKINLRLLPQDAANESLIHEYIANTESVVPGEVSGFHILSSSIDARSRQAWVNLTVNAFIGEPFQQRKKTIITLRDVCQAPFRVVIVGAGPAGLFAALRLAEAGIKPIVIERGKDVRSRRRDLAILNKEGIINPESNYCFGEGGAGTYSDGKLYTRSNKRGNIDRILNIFHQYGAPECILYQSHPHIGTNKLPNIITAMREAILEAGGEIHFEKKLSGFEIINQEIKSAITADGDQIRADAFILATGHSARDIFILLDKLDIAIEAKPFALGVRVEHPQAYIDSLQYHCDIRSEFLPPAAYSLVQQVAGKGVFSFCMCPGGIIAPASTNPGELVVNGWSPSKRNNPYANSGMVVPVEAKDAFDYLKKNGHLLTTKDANTPLLLMYFQQIIEQKAFSAGGGLFCAPAQRLSDFCAKRFSSSLPDCSYVPGVQSSMLHELLPPFISERLQKGFINFDQKMRDRKTRNSFITHEAIVVATESRTSSPVRIPRLDQFLHHPQVKNLYPCGEGAGYAGGIVSAAMDGEKIARQIVSRMQPDRDTIPGGMV